MSYTTYLLRSTLLLGTCTLSFPTARPTSTSSNLLPGEIEPCADPQHVGIGNLAEPRTFTSYEPNHLAEHQDLAEHEDLRVKTLFFHRPSTASTCEALRRSLLSRTWTMSKFVFYWLHCCTCKSEKQKRTDHNYHSVRENLMSSSSQVPKSTVKPVALFSGTKQVESRHVFRQKIFLRKSTGLGNNEPLFRFSHPENSVKSLLEGLRDHMLAEAKSEILKQECEVDSLITCIRELQRQAHSHRLEMKNTNCGYEESRREQARLHEELALREKALRDTRIRNIHGMEELKRAQEMRVDEFSLLKLREKS